MVMNRSLLGGGEVLLKRGKVEVSDEELIRGLRRSIELLKKSNEEIRRYLRGVGVRDEEV